jgi:hypothetical protein
MTIEEELLHFELLYGRRLLSDLILPAANALPVWPSHEEIGAV